MVRIVVLLWLMAISLYNHADAVATLDRSSIADNETVTLSITVDETKLFGGPDTQALEKDFDIVNQQKSSRSQWINGHSSASTQWHFTLAPRHTGVITIPSIEVAGFKTKPLVVTVSEAQTTTGTSHDPIFIEVSTDKQSVYVQEQLLLTVRINNAVQVSNLEMSPPSIDNARVEEASNTRYERSINNRSYITHEIVYAIFPQQSGELTIPAINVTASIPRTRMDAMMRQGERKTFRSSSITVNVKPAEKPGGSWLVADGLTLQESWSDDPQNIKVGQSITRTITTTVDGLMAEQLPDIKIDEPPGTRLYPEKPAFDNQKSNTGITGKRTDRITMIATRPGKITLPAINIDWWNKKTGKMETATLPPIELTVTGKALAPAAPEQNHGNSQPVGPETNTGEPAPKTVPDTSATPKATSRNIWPWQLATALLGLLSLVLAVSLWYSRRQKPGREDTATPDAASQAMQQLKKACADNRPALIRQSLLQWAQHEYPRQGIHALADIGRLLPDERIQKWLKELDASLYQAESTSGDWMAFYRLLEEQKDRPGPKDGPQLYPTR